MGDSSAQPSAQSHSAIGRYGRLLGYARPYFGRWIGVGLVLLLNSAIGILQPWPMKVLFDQVLDHQPMPPWLIRLTTYLPGAHSPGGLLGWLAAAVLLLYVSASLLDGIVSYSWIRVGQRMVYDLMRDLFSVTQRQSLAFHANHPVGDSMSRIMTDSWCVNNVVESLILTPMQAMFTTAAVLFFMLKINPRLTLVSAIVAPIIGVGTLLVGKKLRHIARSRREIEGSIQAHVQQVLSGIHVVQAFGQEGREHDRFTHNAGKAVAIFRRGVLVTNLSNLYTGLMLTAGLGAVLLVGGREVIAGTLTVGDLWIFLAYLNTLQGQAGTLTRTYISLQSRRAEIDRVMEYLETPPAVSDPPEPLSFPALKGDVRIRNVSFGYAPNRPVLKNITLEMAKGTTTAIVGTTGAGKSTLASLLPRFFDPWEGTVHIDGIDVRQLRVRDLRQNVSIVLQESFLFPIPIAENIAFGKPGAMREQIEQAAEMANAAEFIRDLPGGYDAIIGERGATLSGGQKQRLSIARAFLKDAPILILDEPTAALDTVTEQAILLAMQRLMRGRTTLIIAHRLSTIRDADQIAVLEQGQIVEIGSHATLLRAGGVYARFCEAQQTAGIVS